MSFKTLIIFCSILFFSSCVKKADEKNKIPPSVFTKKVKLEQISEHLIYPARAYSKINATVLSETRGIVQKVLVTLGEKVKDKQTLMILYHTDPVYQYAPVQVQAPLSGIVSSVDATAGSHVIEGQALASVINPLQIEIQTEVPPQDLATIQKGLKGEFKIPGQLKEFKVEVFGVSPLVKAGTGTATAKLKVISKMDQVLLPGIQGQVFFHTKIHEGFLVPDTALVYRGEKTFIKIVENKKIKQLRIDVGLKRGGFVEVVHGLFLGAEVVERSSRSVAEGETVTVEANPSDKGIP